MTESHDQTQEEIYYEEAPRSTLAEGIGMFFALLSLCIIGYAGYVWLTPGMEFGDILRRAERKEASVETQQAGEAVASAEERCPQCSMYSMRSIAAVHASFADGSSGYFDGWGCVANWAHEHSTTLTAVEVRDIASADREPQWLDAANAHYRFGTDKLSGSMAPFVAAYATPGHATDDAQRGGEVMDLAALLAELDIEASLDAGRTDTPAGQSQRQAATEAGSEQPGHDHDSMDAMAGAESAGRPASDPAGAAGTLISSAGFSDASCRYCGMFADRSLTHVVVRWQDGSYSQHDSFDCVFNMLAEEGLSIDAMEVTAYDVDNPGSHWLNARTAWFLHDTETVKGSMPPYVAAFANRTDAENAQPGLGGQLLDFNGLAAMWQQ